MLRDCILAVLILTACGRPLRADAVAISPAAEVQAPGRCLLLSDIHFNPLEDGEDVQTFIKLNQAPVEQWEGLFQARGAARYPTYDEDTNDALWRSALQSVSSSAADCDYVLITGDNVVHHFDKAFRHLNKRAGTDFDFEVFVAKTEAFLNLSLAQRLPGKPIYWVLGNNDSDQGNYNVRPHSRFLADLAQRWPAVSGSPQAAKDFSEGGYYAATLPGAGHRQLIVLNSNFWYLHYDDGGAVKDARPGQVELDWLKVQLAQAAQDGSPVTLAMHIPPGIDAHGSSCGTDPQPYFAPDYEQALEALLVQYHAHLSCLFGAHTHFDDWKVYRAQGRAVAAMHLIPSISPVHHNNPSFQVALFDPQSGALKDVSTYAVPDLASVPAGAWPLEYVFTQAYHLPDLSLASLDSFTQALRTDKDQRALFRGNFDAHSALAAPETLKNLQAILCAQTCFSIEDYRSCVCSTH
jgi:hypothetical protein